MSERPDDQDPDIVVRHRRQDVPRHLWPDPAKVRCRCGAEVVEQQVLRTGRVRWVCANGCTDVVEQVLRRAREEAKAPNEPST